MNAQLVCGIAGRNLSQTRVSQFHDMLVGLQVERQSAR